jgi:hypothetical protein
VRSERTTSFPPQGSASTSSPPIRSGRPFRRRRLEPCETGRRWIWLERICSYVSRLAQRHLAESRDGHATPPADVKDFLPYKSYRLFDAIWMIGLSGLILLVTAAPR